MLTKFSFYKKGIKNKTPSVDIDIESAIGKIRGEEYREDVERLRKLTDKVARESFKKTLNYFTFSGTFKTRIADGLIKHSGLMCLDFDDLADVTATKAMICAQPFVHACFVSPSGTGIKAIVKIDPKKHAESFLSLEDYFKKMNLVVDKSGKDITRACFISHDPEAFLNLESVTYQVIDVLPVDEQLPDTNISKKVTESAQPKTGSTEFERKKNLERALYCVEQIEAGKIDITDNDYDDRLMVGFALSTLGDDARELYHRAVQYNDAYEPNDADAKFDDALAKSKFKTPAKFFALCKNHGLLISRPRTIAEAKKEKTTQDIIGDEEGTSDYLKYGIWEFDGVYWSLGLKGETYKISNFTIRILYHVQTSDVEAYRLIELKNIHGLFVTINMNTDSFVSVGTFKKEIARRGNFLFFGGEADLSRLSDKLQRDEKPTDLLEKLGYYARGNFYAFANGIYDCNIDKFLPADDCGIVEHFREKDNKKIQQNYFIPALSKMFRDKDNLYVNDKRFLFVQKQVTFGEWAKLFCKVYGANGELALMYLVAAVYSDIIFRDMNDRFPLFFLFGPKGSGKGALSESMMKLFGIGQKQLMLGGASTVVGFMRKSGQYSNALVWLDEFKNNLDIKKIESIKNLYDRIGYERGKKDNSFQTESTTIDSAVMVSGQDMPIIEEALFTRFILTSFTKPQRTEESVQAFEDLKNMEKGGLSNLLIHLLKHRSLFNDGFKSAWDAELKLLRKDINNNDVDERFLNNYACLTAVCSLLADKEALPFNTPSFRQLAKRCILEQFYVTKGSDSVSTFWMVIEFLFKEHQVVEGRDFLLKNGYLYISINNVHHKYLKIMGERKDPNSLDKSTLENYLTGNATTYVGKGKKTLGGSLIWCLQFNYEPLNINLIRENTAAALKERYREMKLAYDEEDEPTVTQPEPEAQVIQFTIDRRQPPAEDAF